MIVVEELEREWIRKRGEKGEREKKKVQCQMTCNYGGYIAHAHPPVDDTASA